MPPKARPNPEAQVKKKAAPRKKRADRDPIPAHPKRKHKVPAEVSAEVTAGAQLLGMPVLCVIIPAGTCCSINADPDGSVRISSSTGGIIVT